MSSKFSSLKRDLSKIINFNNLYYFHVVAAEGSLANATKVLKVSQPTLSQQIKQLEEQLGESLFSRNSRSLKLNSYGEFVHDFTKKIFSIADNMLTSFSYNQQSLVQNKFCVGMTSSVSRSFAARLLRPLFLDTTIGVRTLEAPFNNLIMGLRSHEIDFVLTEKPDENQNLDGIGAIEIADLRYVFVAGKGFKELNLDLPNKIDKAAYFKYPISNPLQKEVDNFFYKNKINPVVVGESDDLNIMLDATELNHCFAVVPYISASKRVKAGTLKILGDFNETQSSLTGLYLSTEEKPEVVDALGSIKSDFNIDESSGNETVS